MNKYYTGEKLGNYHKKGEGKLPFFRDNVERVIPIYACDFILCTIICTDNILVYSWFFVLYLYLGFVEVMIEI